MNWRKIRFICLALMLSVIAFSLSSPCLDAWAGIDFVIVQPRPEPYHSDEAPKLTQRGWLALIQENDEWFLKETTMKVTLGIDPVMDDDGVPTGLVISSPEYPEAIVLFKHPALKAGRVAIPDNGAWQLKNPDETGPHTKRFLDSFQLQGRVYWLELFKDVHRTANEENLVDKLFIHQAEPERPAIIVPLPMENVSWGDSTESRLAAVEDDSYIWAVWAGDLDHDGQPDLILWKLGYNHGGVCFYLSSLSAPGVDGALPGRAGCQMGTGC
ncbi:hypothetical protein C4J81_12855 [Deltaproteobacteria bacterium Smac51]|nr:hypothetical protein C4J81_12855 [Deltaproteobacteria bacterium Smac51]